MCQAKFAYDVRHVARVIMQMLRAPAARGAHNKGCYFWTLLYMYMNMNMNMLCFDCQSSGKIDVGINISASHLWRSWVRFLWSDPVPM
jgi:hypothetical protein